MAVSRVLPVRSHQYPRRKIPAAPELDPEPDPGSIARRAPTKSDTSITFLELTGLVFGTPCRASEAAGYTVGGQGGVADRSQPSAIGDFTENRGDDTIASRCMELKCASRNCTYPC